MAYLAFVLGTAVLALIMSFVFARSNASADAGTKKMRDIADAIREGAMAFLAREFKALAVFVLVIAVLLGVFISLGTAIAYVLGAVLSALAGWIGMRTATTSNVRTAAAAKEGIGPALKIAFRSGAVMGLAVVGLGLFGLTGYFWLQGGFWNAVQNIPMLFGLSFGASSIALFSRVGGGIFTKAADIGADFVGKVEQDIPEDDPRNPATIADNVGDNVGDIAGMGADLFASFIGSLVATMALGLALTSDHILIPLLVAAAGILASIIGMFFVRTKTEAGLHGALRRGFFVSSILILIAAYFINNALFDSQALFYVVLIGVVAGVLIELATEYFTSDHFSPIKRLVVSSNTGAATNIIEGLSLGFMSSAMPMLVIISAAGLSYWIAGFYGIALAAVAMLSTLGISLAIDAYGPVADNAGGIAEMANMPKKTRKNTDALDAAGNMTAAIGKGFAIGSAAFTALAFFSTFATRAQLSSLSLLNIWVLIGVFLGALLPFVFTSLTLRAVSKAAFAMIEEVRRQFRQAPEILKGTVKPDYRACVDISTKGSLKQMVLPGLLIILSPIVVGLFLGVEALGGMLIGALATAVLLGISLSNAGGAWDNAKKSIEAAGGKGTEHHAAAVIGDTVGDPMKDTSGPSLNILIKLMSIVALTLLPLFL